MKIYLFSDHTGMVDKQFTPDYKTQVVIEGKIKAGVLAIGSQSFEIKGGVAMVPNSAFRADHLAVTVTAREAGKTRHWLCGKLHREPSGAYSPDALDARGALVESRKLIEALQVQIATQGMAIKKLQDRASKKFLGGAE